LIPFKIIILAIPHLSHSSNSHPSWNITWGKPPPSRQAGDTLRLNESVGQAPDHEEKFMLLQNFVIQNKIYSTEISPPFLRSPPELRAGRGRLKSCFSRHLMQQNMRTKLGVVDFNSSKSYFQPPPPHYLLLRILIIDYYLLDFCPYYIH
jgi:hypothetical protein